MNETYASVQPGGFIDTEIGKDIQYILKKSEYTYSSSNRIIKLVEKMCDASDMLPVQKITVYLYDANGNEMCKRKIGEGCC